MDIYHNNSDLTDLIEPGVLQLVCEKTGRALFFKCENTLEEVAEIKSNVANNKYNNAQLLQDYQIFGWEAFRIFVVDAGSFFRDPEKRHALLIDAKTAWEGEFY